MTPRGRAAAVAVLALVLCGCSDSSDDPADPADVVKAYHGARAEGDCDAIRDTLTENSELGCPENPWGKQEPGPEFGAASTDGDSAQVEVTEYFECFNGDPVDYVDTYLLERESGEWRIDDIEFAYPNDDDCIAQNES